MLIHGLGSGGDMGPIITVAITVAAITTVAGIMAAGIIMVIEIVGRCLVNCPKLAGRHRCPAIAPAQSDV
jgi:hypothetical protein